MSKRITELIALGLSFVALGIAILTTESLERILGLDEIRRFYIGWIVFYVGVFISAITTGIGIYNLVSKASASIIEVVSPRVLEMFEYEFEDEYCTPEMVKEVFALDDGVLKRFSHIDENFLTEKLKSNHEIVRCIRKKKSRRNSLCGFFILYPINEECEHLIEQGFLLGSRMIKAEHICHTFREASSIYVSMVYGRDMPTRGFILYLMKKDLGMILRKYKNIRHVYARPASPEGFLMAKRFHLTKMPENNEIWCYEVKKNLSHSKKVSNTKLDAP